MNTSQDEMIINEGEEGKKNNNKMKKKGEREREREERGIEIYNKVMVL